MRKPLEQLLGKMLTGKAETYDGASRIDASSYLVLPARPAETLGPSEHGETTIDGRFPNEIA